MKKCLLAAALLFGLHGFAQQFEPLKAYGTIPADFTTSTLDKIHAHQLDGDESFNAQVYYGIDRILQSGEVCFNDPISQYANRVLDVIKKHNPDMDMDVRIYTVKSPVVNAFATQQGIVFINAGLIAKLENEAQLAFILCHELVHYQEKHVMQGYEQTEEIKANNESYKTVQNVADQVTSARFSRSMEKEADKKGLEMYLNTPYDPHAVNGVFDVLLYSYLPFREAKFDSSFLNFGSEPIPSKFFKTELDTISAEEDIDDWRLTHPNIAKRKKMVKHTLGDSIVTGDTFILPSTDFYETKAIAQFEVVDFLTKAGSYSDALYAAFLMLQEYPDHQEIKDRVGHILFGSAMMANTKDRNEVLTSYKRDEGQVQQVSYFLSKIKSKDLSLMAARYNLELFKSNTNDSTAYKRTQILFGDLSYYYSISPADLGLASEEENKAKWPYSLLIGADTNELRQLYTYGEERAEEIKIEKANTGDDDRDEELREAQEEEIAQIDKHGFKVGAQRIVMLEPQCSHIYDIKSDPAPFKPIETEELRAQLISLIPSVAQETGLELQLVGGSVFDSTQTDDFNDYIYINQLIAEQILFESRANTAGISAQTNQIIEKYGTEYFAISAIVTSLKPNRTESMFFLFNLKTGELEMFSTKYEKGKTSEDVLNQHYEYYFDQVVATPEE